MKLTITEVQNYDKKKDNMPILDKNGVQKYRHVIKTMERGNDQLSGFSYKPLAVGQVIEADVKTVAYNGANKLEFSIVTSGAQKAAQGQSDSAVLAELKAHTVFMKEILSKMDNIYMSISTHQTIESLKKKAPTLASSTAPSLSSIPDQDEMNSIGDLETDAAPVADEDDFSIPGY